VIVVTAEPNKAFAALNVTTWVPTSLAAGVHVSVPVVLPGPGVKLDPAGPVAASDVIASPSGSEAVTFTVITVPSLPLAVAGALTTGARSTLLTVTTVLEEPLKPFAAVKVTL